LLGRQRECRMQFFVISSRDRTPLWLPLQKSTRLFELMLEPFQLYLSPSSKSLVDQQPKIKVVEHYWWTGKPHTELYSTLVDLLKNVWDCKRIVVDATGIGQPVASFLRHSLGPRVISFPFTQRSKSEIGFDLLAAINSGRLKVYVADGSPEYQELWFEVERAKSHYRPSQTMNFYVDPVEGHDDFLTSLALVVEAAKRYQPRSAKGSG